MVVAASRQQSTGFAPCSIVQGKNMTLTNQNRKMKLLSIVASCLFAATALAGCGKEAAEESTADRVKRVEERQKTDANFHVERKAGAAEQVSASDAGKTAAPAISTAAAVNSPAKASVR
jgi:hypothetical protein